MIAHSGSVRGRQGGRGAWRCVVNNGQQAGAGDVFSGGALVGVCLCCWRSAWIVVHSGVLLLVALGGSKMTMVCQHSG